MNSDDGWVALSWPGSYPHERHTARNPGVPPRDGTVPQCTNGILTASFPLEIPTQFNLPFHI